MLGEMAKRQNGEAAKWQYISVLYKKGKRNVCLKCPKFAKTEFQNLICMSINYSQKGSNIALLSKAQFKHCTCCHLNANQQIHNPCWFI